MENIIINNTQKITDEILNGNFEDDYTFIHEFENSNEEYLIFVIHGIGQNTRKLKNSIHNKIKPTIEKLYHNKGNILQKQLHIRMIDWKSKIIDRTENQMKSLVDKNSETRFSKLFINQTPVDLLYYLSINNKYEIINDVVDQMNLYYDIVKKHRPLFKGNVSFVAHSLGSVICYDILRNMRKGKIIENIKKRFSNINTNIYSSEEENKSEVIFYEIHSADIHIKPLKFLLDHFFIIGSPLSLFINVDNHGEDAYLEDMEIVKDFHNIIHPMDPVAYRIEPVIYKYPETPFSFTLPHWQNDGLKNGFFDNLFNILCFGTRKKKEYLNHDSKLGRKRFDFIVQENSAEKAINLIGLIFSHMSYWSNPDVFYYIIKAIHWQLSTS